eukprot:TRINITY_DN24465_c0_g1_i1.p2 TRINITY_DN24465_c0_g1~~TRINITY_DN24465_c0_g1_i1.p2  ORF type:complete len:238 (-),score=17.04 TRINITY_DN24465_c0_g1_i1:12-725(-)
MKRCEICGTFDTCKKCFTDHCANCDKATCKKCKSNPCLQCNKFFCQHCTSKFPFTACSECHKTFCFRCLEKASIDRIKYCQRCAKAVNASCPRCDVRCKKERLIKCAICSCIFCNLELYWKCECCEKTVCGKCGEILFYKGRYRYYCKGCLVPCNGKCNQNSPKDQLVPCVICKKKFCESCNQCATCSTCNSLCCLECRKACRECKNAYCANCKLSLIHICRCRRYAVCRSRWSPYH